MTIFWRFIKSTFAKLVSMAVLFLCLLEVLKTLDPSPQGKSLPGPHTHQRGIFQEYGQPLKRQDSNRNQARRDPKVDDYAMKLASIPKNPGQVSAPSKRDYRYHGNGDEETLLVDLSAKHGGVKLREKKDMNIHDSLLKFRPAPSFIPSASLQSLLSKKLYEASTLPFDSNDTSSMSRIVTAKRFEDDTLALEDVFRQGVGLEPHVTDEGHRGWIENGVVYRPSGKPDDSSTCSKGRACSSTKFEAYVPYDPELFFERERNKSRIFVKDKDRKIILWYTKARYVPPMSKVEALRACPEFPCGVTTNRKYRHASAALLFSGQMIIGTPPSRSSTNQIYVFHNQEPPLPSWFRRSALKSPPWKTVFNWTMSYRMDSDIASHYGIIRKRPTPVNKNYTAILSKKTGVVAWVVSNCDSDGKREKYVHELKKHLPVDVYGACGTLKCNRTMDNECADMIATKYKFYLSFENALCPDYITEKLFKYMSLDMIIVARGSNQYYQHAPSEIFLNTAKFASPKQLAQTILHLHNNDDLYIQMLREKDKYTQLYESYPIKDKSGTVIFVHHHYEAVPFCEMCQKLWNLEKYAKSIPDIRKWFDEKLCQKPTDLHI